jgi:HK97 family phage prohead protease
MERKAFRFHLKAASDDTGVIEGWASTYGPGPDLGGDIVAPGAFTQSIAQQGAGFPFLWHHNASLPLGVARVSDQQKGLYMTAQLVMEDRMARVALAHAKAGSTKGLSIGFDVIKSSPGPNGTRVLNEIRLWEISQVSLPMNVDATVTAAKSLDYIAPMLSQLTDADLSDRETIAQLLGINAELKRLLKAPKESSDAPELARLQAVVDALKKLV